LRRLTFVILNGLNGDPGGGGREEVEPEALGATPAKNPFLLPQGIAQMRRLNV
jgi:hypothetical protein